MRSPGLPMRVRDRMTRPVATVHPEIPVTTAAGLMRRHLLRHLPVVDRRGRLVGIVTDRDLRQVVFRPALRDRLRNVGELLRTLTVSDIMTREVIIVKPGARIDEASRLMHEHKFGALPVVERGRLVGIITETDVLTVLEERLAATGLRTPHTPLPLGRKRGQALERTRTEPSRYEYGFPIPDTGSPWQDRPRSATRGR
jgi:acetoin utilization protein AcuB